MRPIPYIIAYIFCVLPFQTVNAQKEISSWDFFTKYLSNAHEFCGTSLEDVWDNYTYTGSSSSDNYNQTELVKKRWTLTIAKEKPGKNFILDGALEFLRNRVYSYNSADVSISSRMNFLERTLGVKTLNGLGEVSTQGLHIHNFKSLLTVPIITSNNSIVFTHNENYDNLFREFLDQEETEVVSKRSPIWEITNSSTRITLTDTYGDDYHFSCDFSAKNMENYKVSSNECPGLRFVNMVPVINKIELKIKKDKLFVNDEFGEWQWNDARNIMWLESKGQGILNSQPIQFKFIHEAILRPMPAVHYKTIDSESGEITTPLALTGKPESTVLNLIQLQGDIFASLQEKFKLKNGNKIYEIVFNFGEGNLPLLFVGNDSDGNILTFCTYNRFKDEVKCDATNLLNQIKQTNYCVITLNNKSNEYQSYVFRLEGLEPIMDNLE